MCGMPRVWTEMEPGSSSKSRKDPSKPRRHGADPLSTSPEHKLLQAKEQVLNMPSPSREFREESGTGSRAAAAVPCCGGPADKSGKDGVFSRMAVVYLVCIACLFLLAVVGLRLFSIEDKLLRLDTDYQQQQIRIEALEHKIQQLLADADKVNKITRLSLYTTPFLLPLPIEE